MPMFIYPSWDSVLFQEFRKWYEINERDKTDVSQEAFNSICSIAKSIYDHQGGSVVGHMIMQMDLREIEKEELEGINNK